MAVPAALIASMVKVAFAAEVERYDRPGDLLAGERVIAEAAPADDLSHAVLQAHRGWIGSTAPLSDDVTLVVVECVEGARENG